MGMSASGRNWSFASNGMNRTLTLFGKYQVSGSGQTWFLRSKGSEEPLTLPRPQLSKQMSDMASTCYSGKDRPGNYILLSWRDLAILWVEGRVTIEDLNAASKGATGFDTIYLKNMMVGGHSCRLLVASPELRADYPEAPRTPAAFSSAHVFLGCVPR